MRTILVLFLFNSLITFSQKDSTLFRDKFYLEINGGAGLFKYKELISSPSGSGYQSAKAMTYDCQLGINFRSYRLKVGVVGQLMYFYQPDNYINSISLIHAVNFCDKNRKPNVFFGPTLSFGAFNSPYTLFYFKTQIGWDYYYKKFHLGVKCDWMRSNSKIDFDTNLFFEIGYAFNLESFRKKK